MDEKEELLAKIAEINGMVGRIAGRLEREPQDRDMLALLKDYLGKRRELLKKYEPVFGMLTMDCREQTCGERDKKSLSLGKIYFVWRG